MGVLEDDGTELPASQKLSPGGFVPLDNNNTDYTFDSSGVPIPDSAKSGPIPGDENLVPLVLHAVSGATSDERFVLNYDTSKLSLWTNPDRSGSIVSGVTTFDPSVTTRVYAEGTELSAAQGDASVTLNLFAGGIALGFNQLKLTVFTVVGPSNVPGNGKFLYTADAPGSDKATWSVSGGRLDVTGPGAFADDTEQVQWDNEAIVGKVYCLLPSGFRLVRDVNVVKVTVGNQIIGPTFAPGEPRDAGTPTRNGVLKKTVISGTDALPGLSWCAQVTLEGPNGGRGVSQIRVGFIQNLIAFTNRGIYGETGLTLKSNIEGLVPLLDKSDTSIGPWYVDAGSGVFFNPTPDGATGKAFKIISQADTPENGPPLTADQGTAVDATDDVLDTIALDERFQLDVCAQTADTANGANQIFTREATANWDFNGNGTVGQTAPYKWTSAVDAKGDDVAIVNAPDGWTTVSDGSQPPRTSGSTANQISSTQTFAP